MPNANNFSPAHIRARVGLTVTRVGLFVTCVGSIVNRVGSARLFGYQHVGIGNAKCSQKLRVRGFAFWWDIGLSYHICL